jgi:hypothetical protein
LAEPIDLREPDSPGWWLTRLLRRLETRASTLRRWDDYYNGKQPLAFASDKFREAFGDRFPAFASNFTALVVDGERERLEVRGFRFKDPEGDKDLWQIWQDNDLDGSSQIAHTEALIKGLAYTLVEPAAGEGQTPRVTVEDPLDCIHEPDPRDRRRSLAGLKRWVGEDDHLYAFVYLPDLIYKFKSTQPWKPNTSLWEGGEGLWPKEVQFEVWARDGEDWPFPNVLQTVPLVPLLNRPRLKGDGQSEIAPVVGNQDAINKYRADALVAAEFAAFRQRWVIGLDIPTDPDTGRALEPFRAAVDRLWTVPPPDPDDPNPPKVEFGEFGATDLAPYKLMIETEVGHISSISRMPYHYLLGQPSAIPPTGESLKSSEAGLVAKVRTAQIHLGEGWEDTMRLALRAMKDERADLRTAETIWRDPETRQEAARADAAVKLHQAGILDTEGAQSYIGMTQQEIERMRERRTPVEPEAPAAEPAAPVTVAVT